MEVDGQKMLGSRFAFRDLVSSMLLFVRLQNFSYRKLMYLLDKKLSNETNIKGVKPEELAYFSVIILKFKVESRKLTY